MKKLKVLDLFSGTQSIAKAFRDRGHETFTVELDRDHEGIDWYEDIMNITAQDIIDRFGHPDVIWASPPCEKFSVAAIGRHWISGTNLPKTEDTKKALELLEHTVQLIKDLNPKYYFIENPRGKMRKMDCMQDLPRHTVTYCGYGDTRMKPTDLFTNHPNPKFKPPCKNGDTCHEAAPRGSRTGTQGMANAKDRSVIPPELCSHIATISEERAIDIVIEEFIRAVREDSQGFQYVITREEIADKFNIIIRDEDIDFVIGEASCREEIADILFEDDGFDVVLYTDYANMTDEDYESVVLN